MKKAEWMVALQFLALAPFFIPWPENIVINIGNTGLWVFIAGIFLGLYTLYFNRPGNFNVRPKYKKNSKFISQGPYHFCRHPMYLTLIIMAVGLLMMQTSVIKWIFLPVLFIVLNMKASMEEAIMSQHFKEYQNYLLMSYRWFPKLRGTASSREGEQND